MSASSAVALNGVIDPLEPAEQVAGSQSIPPTARGIIRALGQLSRAKLISFGLPFFSVRSDSGICGEPACYAARDLQATTS
jgi:hypothetical protein